MMWAVAKLDSIFGDHVHEIGKYIVECLPRYELPLNAPNLPGVTIWCNS